MTDEEWTRYRQLYADMDRCQICRNSAISELDAPNPGRPFIRPRDGTVLFIGEAPPVTGGFWKLGNQDFVRNVLLPVLLDQSTLSQTGLHSEKALKAFVDGGFYFVQAIKWPLRQGTSYKSLKARERRFVVGHTVESYLQSELALMQPSTIVCLGSAAWDACATLPDTTCRPLKSGDLQYLRLKHHELILPYRKVPLHVTYLPAGRSRTRTEIMRSDVPVYLLCTKQSTNCEKQERAKLKWRGNNPSI